MFQVDAEENQSNYNYGYVEFVPEVNEYFHVLAELNANPCEEIAPDERTDEGRGDEHPEVRFQYAGWKRDECPYYRQHSANKERDVAVFVNPFVR